jgi:hypothetical protein
MSANPLVTVAPTSVIGEFIELVCVDDDLLEAEFESIIAAAWPDGPPDAAPPRQPSPGADRTGHWWADGSLSRLRKQRRNGERDWTRQRSPPRR